MDMLQVHTSQMGVGWKGKASLCHPACSPKETSPSMSSKGYPEHTENCWHACACTRTSLSPSKGEQVWVWPASCFFSLWMELESFITSSYEFPFYRWGNWGLKTLSQLLLVSQLLRVELRFGSNWILWSQGWVPALCSSAGQPWDWLSFFGAQFLAL